MAPPPSKRRNLMPMNTPIVFTSGGTKSYVRFFVFTKEFHVSAESLNHHSFFFATFLNPSGGIKPRSTERGFESDWYNVMDEDLPEGWVLTSDPQQQDNHPVSKHAKNHIAAFEKLLGAIFLQPVIVDSESQLRSMTNNAQYYGCMPALSAAIDGIFARSKNLVVHLQIYPCKMLVLACVLRHKKLYNDAMIFCLGPWTKPLYSQLLNMDAALYYMADAEKETMEKKLYKVHLKILSEKGGAASEFEWASSMACGLMHRSNKMSLPAFVRYCSPHLHKSLLRNNLKLCHRKVESGTKEFDNHFETRSFADRFLCFEIEHFPWNEKEEKTAYGPVPSAPTRLSSPSPSSSSSTD